MTARRAETANVLHAVKKRSYEDKNTVHAGKTDKDAQFKGEKKKKKRDKAADKPKRKPLREEFWSLIDSGN